MIEGGTVAIMAAEKTRIPKPARRPASSSHTAGPLAKATGGRQAEGYGPEGVGPRYLLASQVLAEFFAIVTDPKRV
jgi:hypothetical protein